MAEIKKKLLASLKQKFNNVVNDVNLDEVVNSFVDRGGYDNQMSYKENMTSLITYMAYGKAKNKF